VRSNIWTERPSRVVDINSLAGLSDFDTSGSSELVFGALARMSDVAADTKLTCDYPALSESLWKAASQQIRNMASLGGNLLQRTRCAYFRGGEPFACNKRKPGTGCAAHDGIKRGHALLGGSHACIAVYPGDWAIALVAFDAQVDVLGPTRERTIAVEELHREPGGTPHVETVLQPGELIVRIRVPVTAVGRASTYHKIRDRESYAFVRNNGDPAPVDTMGAQYSIPYCAAVALLADPEDPAMFSDAALSRPDFRKTASLVTLFVDEDAESVYPNQLGARVELQLADGEVRTSAALDAHGTPSDPCSDAERRERFLKLGGAALPISALNNILDVIERLDDLHETRTVTEALYVVPHLRSRA